MKERGHKYVVFAEWLEGFDSLEEAKVYALAHRPAVICERLAAPDGTTWLQEILRHDLLYDRERREWRYMLDSVG